MALCPLGTDGNKSFITPLSFSPIFSISPDSFAIFIIPIQSAIIPARLIAKSIPEDVSESITLFNSPKLLNAILPIIPIVII